MTEQAPDFETWQETKDAILRMTYLHNCLMQETLAVYNACKAGLKVLSDLQQWIAAVDGPVQAANDELMAGISTEGLADVAAKAYSLMVAIQSLNASAVAAGRPPLLPPEQPIPGA